MKIMRRSDEEDPAVSPARTPCLWHVCGMKPALAPGRDASLVRGTYPDLVFLGGAGEGGAGEGVQPQDMRMACRKT
jgi:hypothetical protein